MGRPIAVPRRTRILRPAISAILAVMFLFPLAVMVAGSFRTPGLPPPRDLEIFPSTASLDAYRAAFGLAPLARAMVNSLIVAAIAVPISVLTASLAGFAIAQLPRRRRIQLTAVVLLLLMVPVTAVWIPRFAIFRWSGLVGTWWPLIAPAFMGGSPFYVLLYAYSFRRIPADVIDAARLEGASALRVWWRVAMPLVRATTVAVGLLAFLLSWANFIDPLLYLSREETFTAPLALRYLEQLGPTNWPVLLAGSAAVTAPVVAVFLVAQRYFLQEDRGIGWLGR